MCLLFAVQYAEEVHCINTKSSEKIKEEERNEMKLTGAYHSCIEVVIAL